MSNPLSIILTKLMLKKSAFSILSNHIMLCIDFQWNRIQRACYQLETTISTCVYFSCTGYEYVVCFSLVSWENLTFCNGIFWILNNFVKKFVGWVGFIAELLFWIYLQRGFAAFLRLFGTGFCYETETACDSNLHSLDRKASKLLC